MCNKVVAFRVDLMPIIQNVNATLLLSQILYWTEKSRKKEGWFYKTQKDWEAEIGLSRRCQEAARQKLKSLGLLEERIESCPPKVHFRANVQKLSALLPVDNLTELSEQYGENVQIDMHKNAKSDAPNVQIDMAESAKLDGEKVQINMAKNAKSIYIDYDIDYTENTTEITTDINSVSQKLDHPVDKKTVVEIFTRWKAVMGHSKAQLDDKRRSLIRKALKMGYSSEQLFQAIDGCALTPHNIGENDRGQRYDGLHIILRDAEQIDRFIRNADNPPRVQTKADQRYGQNQRAVEQYLEMCQSGGLVI